MALLLAACGGGGGGDASAATGTGATSGGPGGSGGSSAGTSTPGPGALADCGQVDFAADALRRINALRAAGASCGGRGTFAAAAAVDWHAALDTAAAGHTQDMATRDYVSHTSPEGEGPGTRIAAAGYVARTWAENIAAGQRDTPAVLSAWMASDGHCANLMNPAMHEIALACVSRAGSRYTTYWTLVLGASR